MKDRMRRLFQNIIIWTGIVSSLFYCSCRMKTQTFQHSNNSGKYWATGYLPGWRHTDKAIPFMTEEDYQFLTHIIHFGGIPKPDGSIDVERLQVGTASRKLAVKAAHDAGKPILFSVVGEYPIFNPVIENPQTRRTFINNIVSIMFENGYDGVDLDMEPVCAPFGSFGYAGVDLTKNLKLEKKFPVNHAYISFVKELRSELNKKKTPLFEHPLLTAAIHWRDCHIFGRKEVYTHFDQLNLMTYDMNGPPDGEVTWFDSPIFNGGFKFVKYDKPAYSIEMFVDDCLAAGIPAAKLGIGICLDAMVWRGGEGIPVTEGVTGPRQAWSKAPSHPHQGAQRYTYAEMMDLFYDHANYCWDEAAQASYLSIDEPGSSGDMFISYNDERSVKAKIEYVKQRRLGGFFIWELSADYCPDQPAGQQRPLRKVMQETLFTQK